jgi:hypothetical protein
MVKPTKMMSRTTNDLRLRVVVSHPCADEPRVFEVVLPSASDAEIGRAVERAASAFGRTLLAALDEGARPAAT